jgi:hypothetical protein
MHPSEAWNLYSFIRICSLAQAAAYNPLAPRKSVIFLKANVAFDAKFSACPAPVKLMASNAFAFEKIFAAGCSITASHL